MYNVILLFNPLDINSLTVYSSLYSLYEQNIPIRIGFIPYPTDILSQNNNNDDGDAKLEASKTLMSIISYIVEKIKTPKKLAKFVNGVSSHLLEIYQSKQMEMLQMQMENDDPESIQQLVEQLENAVSKFVLNHYFFFF